MISFLAPWVLGVAALAAAAVTLLHFLSVRRPPTYVLPTARFVTARDARAVSRSARPSDLLLLLLRVLAVLAAGVALAGPRWSSSRESVAHIVVADPSWHGDSASMMGRVLGDANQSGVVRVAWLDSTGGMRDELGAAIPAAWHEAGVLLRDVPSLDSVALHVFAPRGGSDSYRGWSAWRSGWPGRVAVHVPGDSAAATPRTASTSAVLVRERRDDDVVRAAIALQTGRASVGDGADSSVVLSGDAGTGRVRIEWPASGAPTGWTARSDTAGALVAGNQALVQPWIRRAAAPEMAGLTRVIARWGDGLPAAVETTNADGCLRTVAVAVPNGSDVLNTSAGQAFVRMLLAPCGEAAGARAALPQALLADSGGARALATTTALRRAFPPSTGVVPAWLPSVLLGVAIALLLLELALRSGTPAEPERA